MKKIVIILVFLTVISFSLFATTETNFIDEKVDTSLISKNSKVIKVNSDDYFSMNFILGLASSPIVAGDLYITSGLGVNIYKYYETKNYGTNLKISVLGEDRKYGSYKLTPGLFYRNNIRDNLELYTGLGISLSYYNKMDNKINPVNLFYMGIDGELGFRFYPVDENHKFAIAAGLDSAYMWNISFIGTPGVSTRFQINSFVGFSYIID